MKGLGFTGLVFLLLLAAPIALATQMHQGGDITQIRKAIENGNMKFGEAVRTANAAAIAALYSEDAILMPPNSDMIKGRAGIEGFWKGGLDMGIKDAVLTTVEVLSLGNLACEIGRYNLKIQPAGQAAIEDNGKYVVIWKKQTDGSWKLHVDIWNTNLLAQK